MMTKNDKIAAILNSGAIIPQLWNAEEAYDEAVRNVEAADIEERKAFAKLTDVMEEILDEFHVAEDGTVTTTRPDLHPDMKEYKP